MASIETWAKNYIWEERGEDGLILICICELNFISMNNIFILKILHKWTIPFT
jgi:hypothetical protein